jgi:hypothetical protein
MGTPLAPPPPPPDRLRQRAGLLRTLARRLELAELVQLPALTGTDTWLGAKPFDCDADIRRLVGRFSIAGLDLRASARLLDLQADATIVCPGPS